MEAFFEARHACWGSQLLGLPLETEDSPAVSEARSKTGIEGLQALAAALDRQLRYRESAEVYSQLVDILPEDGTALRLRAGRRLSTLQLETAEADLLACLNAGGDPMELHYRLGLCAGFGGNYRRAMLRMEDSFPLCGDEMAIAVIYWHTIFAWKAGKKAVLLPFYRSGMDVGHHYAYEAAVSVMAGKNSVAELEKQIGQADDLDHSMLRYGLCAIQEHNGDTEKAQKGIEEIIRRDGFWVSYAWLAAWTDDRRRRA